jgi:hypothetical protein
MKVWQSLSGKFTALKPIMQFKDDWTFTPGCPPARGWVAIAKPAYCERQPVTLNTNRLRSLNRKERKAQKSEWYPPY